MQDADSNACNLRQLFTLQQIISSGRKMQMADPLEKNTPFIPLSTNLSHLNIHQLEVVSRYRDLQFRVGKTYYICYISDLIVAVYLIRFLYCTNVSYE